MKRRLSIPLLITMVLIAFIGQSLSGPAPETPARPSNSDWDAYKAIYSAMGDETQKAKVFTQAEIAGWCRVQDWLDGGKEHFKVERFEAFNITVLNHIKVKPKCVT